MQRLISNSSSLVYRRVAKPILFRQSPDSVHEHLITTGGLVQRSRFLLGLLRWSWAHQPSRALEQTLCGINFRTPVGLSAGFDKNFQLPLLLKAVGFGFMEGGSLTYEPCEGNPRPWFYRLPKSKSLVVYAGLANQGSAQIVERIKQYSSSVFDDFPLNISIAKTNSKAAASDDDAVDDYLGSLKRIQAAGVGSMITLNISCPNTYGGEPFTTPDRLEKLLVKVDDLSLSLPVFLKMPANLDWSATRALLEVADKHSIAGVTICNLSKDRRQELLKDELPASVKGNLSGKPTQALSNELIRQTYKHYGRRFVIIGVGGIFSAEDAYTKIRLGASLAELITGMIFEGPQLVGQITAGLEQLLARDGFSSITEAIGVDNPH